MKIIIQLLLISASLLHAACACRPPGCSLESLVRPLGQLARQQPFGATWPQPLQWPSVSKQQQKQEESRKQQQQLEQDLSALDKRAGAWAEREARAGRVRNREHKFIDLILAELPLLDINTKAQQDGEQLVAVPQQPSGAIAAQLRMEPQPQVAMTRSRAIGDTGLDGYARRVNARHLPCFFNAITCF